MNPPPDSPDPRGPRAFSLDARRPDLSIENTPDFLEAEREPPLPPPARRAGFLPLLFWSAAGLLATLFLVDAVWALAQSLSARLPWLGAAVWGLLGIVALGLTLFLLRELFSLLRLGRVAKLRQAADALAAAPETAEARRFAQRLADFYAADAGAAAGRQEVARVLDEIHDGPTLLAVTERALLAGRDDLARQAIAQAARRVSVVTALSPRAIVDVAFVLAQSVALIRRLSAIYGSRASGMGLLRLAGRVLAHLAVTGGVAMADEFLGQIVGAGLAARLSARLGEGMLNGVLTARAGIAAVELCRPMPFLNNERIILSEVVKSLLTPEKVAENPAV